MLWSVKGLPCQQEDLSSVLRGHIAKLGAVACDCDPTSREVETGKILGEKGGATGHPV